jgi:hypothetical protein
MFQCQSVRKGSVGSGEIERTSMMALQTGRSWNKTEGKKKSQSGL